MNPFAKTAFLFLLLFSLSETGFSQKAFEAVYYTGKTTDLEIKFMFADGYPEGSEIITTHRPTRKTSQFLPENPEPDSAKHWKFYHLSKTPGKTFSDYFILDSMQLYFDKLPASISGRYYFGGKTYPFILNKN